MNSEQWLARRAKRLKRKKKGKVNRLHLDPFYRSKAWEQLRYRVLTHYGRECMLCGKTKGQMNVDHIQPRKFRPDLALEFTNMQVLCWQCNKTKGNKTADFRPGAPSDAVYEVAGRQIAKWGYDRLTAVSFTPSDGVCRIYKCGKPSTDGKGYCEEHSSPLRAGKPPGAKGSAPVIIKRNRVVSS